MSRSIPHHPSNMVEAVHVWLPVKLFINDVSANWSSRMHPEVYRALLSAQPNSANWWDSRTFTEHIDHFISNPLCRCKEAKLQKLCVIQITYSNEGTVIKVCNGTFLVDRINTDKHIHISTLIATITGSYTLTLRDGYLLWGDYGALHMQCLLHLNQKRPDCLKVCL